MASTGHFYSLFADLKRKKLSSCGLNLRGQCGFDPSEDEIIEYPKIFKNFDTKFTPDETILEIHSGNSHNIIRTNKALYFVGNTNNWQLEEALGNNTGLDYLLFHELNFSEIYDYRYEDVERVQCKYDKSIIYFKNGDIILFGNLLMLNPEDAVDYEIFKADRLDYRIRDFGIGFHSDLIAVEY